MYHHDSWSKRSTSVYPQVFTRPACEPRRSWWDLPKEPGCGVSKNLAWDDVVVSNSLNFADDSWCFLKKVFEKIGDWGYQPMCAKVFFFSVDKLREQHLSTCLVCWVCQAQNVENQSIYLLNWAGNILGCCSAPSRNARPRQVLQLQRHLPDNRHIFFSVSGIYIYIFFFFSSSPGWVYVLGSSQERVRAQQFLAWEDGGWKHGTNGHMWWCTIGTLLEGPFSLKAAMSGWCPAIVTPLTESQHIVERNCRRLRISRSWHRPRGHDASGVQWSTEDSTWSSKAKWNMWAE